MKRRTFLHRFGSILAALGLAEAEWLTLGNRYYQALAQPSPRKLALLVGINDYRHSALTGCLTDVELQKELLINRFGFKASDILCLTDEKASREAIETAFLEHLINQAQPEDAVFFHFSGYGSQINLQPLPALQNALVPVDIPEVTQNQTIVNYLLEETLLLLWRSLPTQRAIAVLDTSYNASMLPAVTRIRARLAPAEAQLAAAELEFQQQLQNKLASKNLLNTQSAQNTDAILTATSNSNQLATEVVMSGFSAGLFTYALTQYLWSATEAPTIQVCLREVASSMLSLGGNSEPGLLNGNKNQLTQTLAETRPNGTMGAEGVVVATEEDGRTVRLFLPGIPPQVLEYYGINSRLTTSDQSVELILRSRTGLTAKAQIAGDNTPPQVGQLVQEAVRVLPRNINLTLGLDPKLERIERVDATSAIATIARVTSTVAGEQPADYVFAKLPASKDAAPSTVVSPSRYGLFSRGGELIPNTDGQAGEAVKVAMQRLEVKLQTLLAAKLWRLTENQGSSRLGVKATLEIVNNVLLPRVIIEKQTARINSTQSNKKLLGAEAGGVPNVPIGSKILYRVENISDRPLYLMLLGLNSSRTALALYPWQKDTDTEATKPQLSNIIIAPGETRSLPQTTSGFEWVVQGPASLSETQLIFSTAPFNLTLLTLQAAKHPSADQHRIQPLINPLEVAQAVLQDLHNASVEKTNINPIPADYYAFDVNDWASLSFVYQVV